MSTFQFPSEVSIVKEASRKVLQYIGQETASEAILFDIKLCFEEALINAIKYGNKLDKTKTVNVDISKGSNKIEIVVTDQGKGYDFSKVPDPTREENLEKTNGRGIFLIIQLMDQVIYERNGSRVRMIKDISKSQEK